jgi:hypothetical protein
MSLLALLRHMLHCRAPSNKPPPHPKMEMSGREHWQKRDEIFGKIKRQLREEKERGWEQPTT